MMNGMMERLGESVLITEEEDTTTGSYQVGTSCVDIPNLKEQNLGGFYDGIYWSSSSTLP